MFFTLADDKFKQRFPYTGPRDVIEAFRSIQYVETLTYSEFFRQFKRRLRIYTGRSEVSFFGEGQVVKLLQALGLVEFADGE